MRRTLRWVLIVLVSLAAILGILFAAVGMPLPRRSFPQISGEIHLKGLGGPVDIYRDPLGIPQIYAGTPHDLFFAEGYVHAQDRFFQMDFWRHIGSGRLSEMFGKSQLDTDIFLRRMGWARVAQQELDTMDPQPKAILQAYADGVNAYLADHQGSEISLEYAVLKLITPGYRIEPWTPLHSLTWAKAMAWDLRGNMDEEGERTTLLKLFSREQVDDLYPPYPTDHPLIVTNVAVNVPSGLPVAAQDPASIPAAQVAAQTQALSAQMTRLDLLLGPGGTGAGSNNWVISGKLTATGKPLLANDPHLGPQMPSIWYEIGMHCRTKNADCPFEMTGFSFAGAPGVVIGHNDRITWGFTNVSPDVQDVYIEKINPQNPNQYEVNGQWQDMKLVTETIQVAGGKPDTITVRYTRHGPILWEDPKVIDDFRQKSGVALPPEYRLALRWTALEVSHTFPALWVIDQAQNWDEFRQGAELFDVPAQNFVYADVDGNIGYQMPGKVPIRAHGDGRYYVPGWTDEYEWTGYIPFDKLPNAFNPPEGYLATANNAVAGSNYPYLITTDWDYGFRAQRITDLIRGAPGKIDTAYIEKMQGDNKNLSASFLVPALLKALGQVDATDPTLAQAQDLLANWDEQQSMDSAQAAVFETFWRRLLLDTFGDKLPKDYEKLDGSARWYEVVRRLLDKPDSPWWDARATPQVETRDDVLRQAFGEGVAELVKLQGKDPKGWNWGSLHTITFKNKTLGESGIAPIEALFNRGPFRTAGGEGIINATGWDINAGYEVNWLPSMRMIVDLSSLPNSLTINTTGQSGHAYNPHYADMADLWRNIQYHPMRWDTADIQANSEGHLVLLP